MKPSRSTTTKERWFARFGARVATALAMITALAVVVVPLAAQDRAVLIRTLATASDFRLRAQAAIALGASGDANVAPHLVRALRDTNPAVRSVAASSLGRVASRDALPPLRAALRDSSASVRAQAQRAIAAIEARPRATATTPATATAPPPMGVYPPITMAPAAAAIAWDAVRWVVTLGRLENRSALARPEVAQLFRSEVERHLRAQRGVAVVADSAAHDASVTREIARRRLPKVRLEGNVNRVDRRAATSALEVRCEVSLVVMDEPARIVRGMLNGAATGMETAHVRAPAARDEWRLTERALAGAVRSAVSRAPQVLARAGR